jgi:hypothetical protein
MLTVDALWLDSFLSGFDRENSGRREKGHDINF